MKQNRTKEQWCTRMNRGDEMKRQEHSQKSMTTEQHTQMLMNEPRRLAQSSVEPNQCKPNWKAQNGIDNIDRVSADHLMKEGRNRGLKKVAAKDQGIQLGMGIRN